MARVSSSMRAVAAVVLALAALVLVLPTAVASGDPARDAFAQRWPAQEAATQDLTKPATTRWALLIGINEHMGRVADNVGSRQDADDLRQYLLNLGWRDDHILVIADYDATRANILQALDWLARKTNGNSVAVFQYSGHSKKWYGQDHDGDGEVTDEGLWPTDDRFIVDSELVAKLANVNTAAMWVNISSCNSQGFNDPGLERNGRLLTFSTRESQKSYEDPRLQNSVWGFFMVDRGLLHGDADTSGDGIVTVEEAFHWANPRAADYTRNERYGAQQAWIVDGLQGDFRLDIPPTSAPVPDKSKGQGADDGKGKKKRCILGICI